MITAWIFPIYWRITGAFGIDHEYSGYCMTVEDKYYPTYFIFDVLTSALPVVALLAIKYNIPKMKA